MLETNHVHTFKRLLKKGKRTSIFICAHPHCGYERNSDYLAGKAAKCPYCGKEFILTRAQLNKQGLLHCSDCTKGRGKDKAKEFIEEILEREQALPKEENVA